MLPKGFTTLASTETVPFAAACHTKKPLYAVQFHPESSHSEKALAF
jgi:GMP synthase (glutamine-hydrolysing)